jgi:serine/threonine protein kinase
MAEVWKAQHRVLGTYVAIKFLIPGFASMPDIEKRFLDEGKRQAQLSHPNIVSAYDFLYEDQRSYLIMKMVEGENLDDRLFRLQGPLDLAQVLTISGDVLRALDYAHSQHVIHRDIKPSNILIDHEGRAFVMDFGIALVLGEQRATRVGVAVGTPHFMSPEQIVGARVLDQRTDIYSYGCVLYEMLTGRLPFDAAEGEGGTDFVIQNMHLNQPAIPPRRLNPSIPEHIERAVLRCLEKKADDRFNTCHDLLTALVSSPPPPSRQTLPIQPARHATVIEGPQVEVPRGGTVLEQPALHPQDARVSGQQVVQPDVKPQGFQQVRTPEPRKPKSSNLIAIISGALLALIVIGGGVYWYTHRPDNKPASEAKVNLECNLDCTWEMDGNPQGQMSANQPASLTLAFGDHKFSATTMDKKQHLEESFSISSASETPTETISFKLGRSKPPGPEGTVVAVQCNLDCNWALDGAPQGQMSANQPSSLRLSAGKHQVSAMTTDNQDQANLSFNVSSASQTLAETIDLASVRKIRLAKGTTLAGNWNGKYTNETTGLSSPIRLKLNDSSDSLSGTMTFDPGGKFQSACSVNGVYDAHKLSMYLELNNCRGLAPNNLSDKMIFMSVHRGDREARGMNSTQTSWIQLNKQP